MTGGKQSQLLVFWTWLGLAFEKFLMATGAVDFFTDMTTIGPRVVMGSGKADLAANGFGTNCRCNMGFTKFNTPSCCS